MLPKIHVILKGVRIVGVLYCFFPAALTCALQLKCKIYDVLEYIYDVIYVYIYVTSIKLIYYTEQALNKVPSV